MSIISLSCPTYILEMGCGGSLLPLPEQSCKVTDRPCSPVAYLSRNLLHLAPAAREIHHNVSSTFLQKASPCQLILIQVCTEHISNKENSSQLPLSHYSPRGGIIFWFPSWQMPQRTSTGATTGSSSLPFIHLCRYTLSVSAQMFHENTINVLKKIITDIKRCHIQTIDTFWTTLKSMDEITDEQLWFISHTTNGIKVPSAYENYILY